MGAGHLGEERHLPTHLACLWHLDGHLEPISPGPLCAVNPLGSPHWAVFIPSIQWASRSPAHRVWGLWATSGRCHGVSVTSANSSSPWPQFPFCDLLRSGRNLGHQQEGLVQCCILGSGTKEASRVWVPGCWCQRPLGRASGEQVPSRDLQTNRDKSLLPVGVFCFVFLAGPRYAGS